MKREHELAKNIAASKESGEFRDEVDLGFESVAFNLHLNVGGIRRARAADPSDAHRSAGPKIDPPTLGDAHKERRDVSFRIDKR